MLVIFTVLVALKQSHNKMLYNHCTSLMKCYFSIVCRILFYNFGFPWSTNSIHAAIQLIHERSIKCQTNLFTFSSVVAFYSSTYPWNPFWFNVLQIDEMCTSPILFRFIWISDMHDFKLNKTSLYSLLKV